MLNAFYQFLINFVRVNIFATVMVLCHNSFYFLFGLMWVPGLQTVGLCLMLGISIAMTVDYCWVKQYVEQFRVLAWLNTGFEPAAVTA